ncbi:MAG TPA: hypothetical protein VIY99_09425 [Terracidiphilus sp.]
MHKVVGLATSFVPQWSRRDGQSLEHDAPEPLSTIWPQFKIKQIPTGWPKFKLEPIGGNAASLLQSRAP